ncbi:YczE/YyaS/YitT family protein [Desulfitobacterium dichloroeliminans]|nr:membrane protein [Desulfitobacterium dichloroeliminans]
MSYIKRIVYLVLGTFILSVGIVMTMQANLGYAPWDVFHRGISDTIGMSIGSVSIVASLVISAVVVLLGEKLGFGTIVNIFAIGIYMDILLEIIPEMQSFGSGLIMLILGLFICAFSTYLYIASGFGAGPRDSLMVALERLTKLSVGVCRGTIEVVVCIVGWLLGGPVGMGTIISAFGIGVCVQLIFSWVKFDATGVKHETINETIKNLKGFLKRTLKEDA